MKLSILILALIATTTTAFSQNYMDEIAKETCKCLTQITDDLNPEKYAMELGLCMLNASNPYKKQLKKDFKIDLDKIDTHAEELEGPFVEWRPNDGQQFYAVPGEPLDRFHQRMVKLYQWIESREEDVIVMVTHWAVIRFFTGQEDVENCGVRVVDFDRVRLKEDIVSLCMKQ